MKVASLHERIANTRKHFHWQVAHQLCNLASTIFVENLNLVGLSRGMLGKHCLDAGFCQFFQILEQCCFKRGVYFQKVDSRKTSQICPHCGTETGKKDLSERVHVCENCGTLTDRDVAGAQVVLQRGLAAVLANGQDAIRRVKRLRSLWVKNLRIFRSRSVKNEAIAGTMFCNCFGLSTG